MCPLTTNQIDCRNRRGRLRKGRKVTGIVFVNNGAEMLVTTNDSRCRLISLDDFSMTFKYGGLRNNNMQIKASCGCVTRACTQHSSCNGGCIAFGLGWPRRRCGGRPLRRLLVMTAAGVCVTCASAHRGSA